MLQSNFLLLTEIVHFTFQILSSSNLWWWTILSWSPRTNLLPMFKASYGTFLVAYRYVD